MAGQTSTAAAVAGDVSHFLEPSFDPSVYVAQLISGNVSLPPTATPTREPQKVDISLTISRLNLAIDQLTTSISDKVTANASELLQRTSGISSMREGLAQTRDAVTVLQKDVNRLQMKVHTPFVRLQECQRDLLRYEQAADLVSRANTFVTLARKLDAQMNAISNTTSTAKQNEEDAVVGVVHGSDLARAAHTIKQISTFLERENALFDAAAATTPSSDAPALPCSILDLEMVRQTLPAIERAQKSVTDSMEDMIVRGLRDLSPIMLSSSLQTAFNLGTLAPLVKDLLFDLTEVVKERISAAIDLESLSRSLNMPLPTLAPTYTPSYKTWSARNQTADSTVEHEHAVWTAAFWKRLETLIVHEMGAVCSKVYTLEKVLKLKTDSDTGVNFLDSALEILDARPSVTFWNTFATFFKTKLDQALSKSPFLLQTLTQQSPTPAYPRLIRVFQAFFAKVSVYTDIVYDDTTQSQETVDLLRTTLGRLEQMHMDKATQNLAQTLQSDPLSPADADKVLRLATNLLDSHRFDPLLTKATTARIEALYTEASRTHRPQSTLTRLATDLKAIGAFTNRP